MHARTHHAILVATLTLAPAVALARPDQKAPPPRGGGEVKVLPGAGAPSAPDESARLKKTPLNEYNKNPGKKEIKKVEDLIYNLEKPAATIWQWKQDPEGHAHRDVGYVTRGMTDLEAALVAIKAKEPSWRRIAEYEQRIAFLRIAAAAQAKHYRNVAAAKDKAEADVEAAAQAAWAAKRVTDEGMTSDAHKASMGTIRFATAPLAVSGAGATATVDVGDPLFLRAYFAESVWNTLHTAGIDCTPEGRADGSGWIRTWAQLDGGEAFELETLTLDRAAMEARTTSTLTEAGSLTKGGTYTNPDEKRAPFRWLTQVAVRIRPGTAKVRLEAVVWCPGASHAGIKIASGEVTIRATAAQLAEVGKRGSFKMAPSQHPKARLAPWRAAMIKHYAAEWELLDLRSTTEFGLRRDEKTSVVLSRVAGAVILLRHKQHGHCELVSVSLTEPFDGRTYGPQQWGYAEPRPFVCNLS